MNTLREAWIEVKKDFSDDNPADVDITLTCTSGTVDYGPPSDRTASDVDAALIRVYGFNVGATCGVSESRPDDLLYKYVETQFGCASIPLIHGETNTGCEITNTLTSATIEVSKVYAGVDAGGVSVMVECEQNGLLPASISPAPPVMVVPGSPVTFTVIGFPAWGAGCTVTEEDVPEGYYAAQTPSCSEGITNGSALNCTLYNFPTQASFAVTKDFTDDSLLEVDVSLDCGLAPITVTPPSQLVMEGPTVYFLVEYFPYPSGTVCSVTENVPHGYLADESQCDNVGVTLGTSIECMITNEPTEATITVKKDFDDDNAAEVDVTLECDDGQISPSSTLPASETMDAVFAVKYFDAAGVDCQATENGVPSGYTKDESECETIPIVDGASPVCTILNEFHETEFRVSKNFEPDLMGGAVEVTLNCGGETMTPAGPLTVGEGAGLSGIWTVSGYDGDPVCTATETGVPPGYETSQCQGYLVSEGECTIVNERREDTFTVRKNFVPDNTAGSAQVTLSCQYPLPTAVQGSTPNPVTPQTVTELVPGTWSVYGYEGDPLCTATESPIPAGYGATGTPVGPAAGTCQALLSAGECLITNTLLPGSFTVRKDFVPDAPGADVTARVVCGAAAISPASGTVQEGAPRTFMVTGYSGDPVCTATEYPNATDPAGPPPGYVASGTPAGTCQALLSVGSCEITNTRTATSAPVGGIVQLASGGDAAPSVVGSGLAGLAALVTVGIVAAVLGGRRRSSVSPPSRE